MKKSFVLDTNVLLHSATALTAFADNEVVLPIQVIEELDAFKKGNNDLARNARGVIRTLDRLRAKGRLAEGVPLDETGGTVRVCVTCPSIPREAGLSPSLADNQILAVAYDLMKRGEPVIFVSKDINARIKSDALGLRTMDFEKQKVDFDRLYAGWRRIEVAGDLIDRLHETGRLDAGPYEMLSNEFALLVDEAKPKHTTLARREPDADEVRPLAHEKTRPSGIRARNREQQMALELLLDDRVQLVTLVGQAGTGKTLLALAAGLHRVGREEAYERLLVTRPIVPVGRDIGYLPGSKEEKLTTWMEPIFDNLKFLMQTGRKKDERVRADDRIEELLQTGLLELEALTYIRGRSIPNHFMIVDEAQNLTPHEVKTIISRAGEETKVVLTGDPYQIDNPNLDSSSNGLTYTAERMKGESICGHVTLTKSERSTLASLAAERL